MQSDSPNPERKRRLRDLVTDAFDVMIATTDLPIGALETSVDAVVDSVGKMARAPNVEEVASIVKTVLEKSGEGAVAAAEAAGDIAEKIVEGFSDLDLNV